jgi:hypothetical protein
MGLLVSFNRLAPAWPKSETANGSGLFRSGEASLLIVSYIPEGNQGQALQLAGR